MAIEDSPAPIPLAKKDKIALSLRQGLARPSGVVIGSPYLQVECHDVPSSQLIELFDGL